MNLDMAEMKEKVVIIGGVGLGDTLIQMVLAENLTRAGFAVTLLSPLMQELADWFPRQQIKPMPPEISLAAELAQFSKVFASDTAPKSRRAPCLRFV